MYALGQTRITRVSHRIASHLATFSRCDLLTMGQITVLTTSGSAKVKSSGSQVAGARACKFLFFSSATDSSCTFQQEYTHRAVPPCSDTWHDLEVLSLPGGAQSNSLVHSPIGYSLSTHTNNSVHSIGVHIFTAFSLCFS